MCLPRILIREKEISITISSNDGHCALNDANTSVETISYHLLSSYAANDYIEQMNTIQEFLCGVT